jgi:hypothetical protein
MNGLFLFLGTFLAATIEGVEMAAILVGVGTTRGWRSTILGAVAGFSLLAALTACFAFRFKGCEWSSDPCCSFSDCNGLRKLCYGLHDRVRRNEHRLKVKRSHPRASIGMRSWLPSKRLLEGLEIAFIVVTFGAEANQLAQPL